MQAGDVGVLITVSTITPDTPQGFSLAGATVTLIVTDPSGAKTSKAMANAIDNLSATYLSLPGDFALAGGYEVQARAYFSSAKIIHSPILRIDVGASL